jgi:hypothetical protein
MDPITTGINFVTKVADKLWPDPAEKANALYKLQELKQNGELAFLQAETELAKGQLEINKIEAASTSIFVSGARPFIMWTCGVSFAYVALLEPILRFIASVGFGYTGAFPAIDTNLTLQVLLGILGLGALRTTEKIKMQ